MLTDFRYFTLVILAASMAGCATMTQEECRSADWRTVGFEDGSQGEPANTIGGYREACAEFGVTPDLVMYRAGHGEGLTLYCTESSGYDEGRRGGSYAGVCPDPLEKKFLDGFRAGKDVFVAEQRVRELESEIDRIDREIAALEKDITGKEQELVATATTESRRRDLLADIKRATKDTGALSEERIVLTKEQALAEAAFAEIKARHARF